MAIGTKPFGYGVYSPRSLLAAPIGVSRRSTFLQSEAVDEVQHSVAPEAVGPGVANLRRSDLTPDALLLVEQVIHLDA